MFNLKSATKQSVDLIVAAPKLGVINIAKAAAHVSLSPVESRDNTAAISENMKLRYDHNQQGYVKSVRDLDMNNDYISKTQEVSKKYAYMFIKAMEGHTATIIHSAAMEKAQSELGLKGDNAIKYADTMVDTVVGSSKVSKRASIQTGPEYLKLVTDFMHMPITHYNILQAERYRNLDRPTLERLALNTKLLLSVALIPSIITAGIGGGLKVITSKGDKERDKNLKQVGVQTLVNTLDINFPFSGRMADTLINKGDLSYLAPTGGELKTVAKVGNIPFQLGRHGEIGPKEFMALIDTFTYVTGMPTTAVNQLFKTVIAVNPELKRDMDRAEKRASRK